MNAPRQLSDDAIERMVMALAGLAPGDLAELRAVRAAARRGSATAMSARSRERFERGMAALDAIIKAVGGPS